MTFYHLYRSRWVYNILQTISTTLFSMHVLVEQELPTLPEHLPRSGVEHIPYNNKTDIIILRCEVRCSGRVV
jgi:hypothetical protein